MTNQQRYALATAALMVTLFVVAMFDGVRQSNWFPMLEIVMVAGISVLIFARFASRFRRILGEGSLFSRFRVSSKLILTVIAGPIVYFCLAENSDVESRKMEIFSQGVQTLEKSQTATKILGTDIRVSWPIQNNSVISAESGHAELAVPVAGNAAKGHLYIHGVKKNHQWAVTELYLIPVGSGKHVDLLAGGSDDK
jgi:Cytochrome oxidase complex assembly protein 1